MDDVERKIAKRDVNYTYRRWAAAPAVLRCALRDQPEATRQLRLRVYKVLGLEEGGRFNDATVNAVAAWCDGLHLGCEDIRFEALALALGADYDRPAVGDEPLLSDDPEVACYRIPWIPGESKNKFLARALKEFYREKKADEESGGVAASDRINPKHVEWFVRFQVHGDGFDRIAKTAGADRQDVKRAVRGLASLLQLKLPAAKPGRPKGRGGRNRPAHNIVRRPRRS